MAFYLIAQMVGAGQLIQLLFGLDYGYAVIVVGILMIVYVAYGGMKATTWVQVIKACLLLDGATIMAIGVLWHYGFNPNALDRGCRQDPAEGRGDPRSRRLREQPRLHRFTGPRTDVRHRWACPTS